MKDFYAKIRSKLVLNFTVRCNRPLHYLKYQHLQSEAINLPVTCTLWAESRAPSIILRHNTWSVQNSSDFSVNGIKNKLYKQMKVKKSRSEYKEIFLVRICSSASSFLKQSTANWDTEFVNIARSVWWEKTCVRFYLVIAYPRFKPRWLSPFGKSKQQTDQ